MSETVADGLADLAEQLRDLPSTLTFDAARIDVLRRLEELKAVLAAAQAQVTADFVTSQRAEQRAAGVPGERIGRGVTAQVALALRCSPWRAQRYAGWAAVLTTELPETFAALRRGETSEWRAMLVARETIFLSREHRGIVDARLAPRLAALGDRKVEAEAKKAAYALDPTGYVERSRAAAKDRRVAVRPAPDSMCRLTATLPVAQGVAAYASLVREADQRIGTGDPRSRGQIMADTLVTRLTGQATAEAVPVEINLVMTDTSLLGSSHEAAHVDGFGPLPAPLARELALGGQYNAAGASGEGPPFLRRLFRAPRTGELAAMETHRRKFTANQRRFLRLRDQTCRTPRCDAPIRHTDHVIPAERRGPTTIANGQGLCAACNHAKQAPDWHTTVVGDLVEITTPTGHTYRHAPPAPPGVAPPRRYASPVERRLAEILCAAA